MSDSATDTCFQDCSVIINAFENAAYSDTTEASVFAPLVREPILTQHLADMVNDALESYSVSPTASGGDISDDDTSSTASAVAEWMQNCLPCYERATSLLDLEPDLNLLDLLEEALKERLAALKRLYDSLQNFDIYEDLCSLLELLNFICVPDLQRLVMLLMVILMGEKPKLMSALDFIKALLFPLFLPLLLGIVTLLDIIKTIVVTPLDCIIEVMEQAKTGVAQLKTGIEASKAVAEDYDKHIDTSDGEQLTDKATDSISELENSIREARDYIVEKFDFYIDQIQRMMAELQAGSLIYLDVSLIKLKYIRLIALIIAIISAAAMGHVPCDDSGVTSASAMNKFLDDHLNPRNAYKMSVDDKGHIHIVEPNIPSTPSTPSGAKDTTVLSPGVAEKVSQLRSSLQKTTVVLPCGLKTEVSQSDKIDKWIAELNSA